MKIENIVFGKRMRKDLKLADKRGYNISKFDTVVNMLCNCEPLPEKYKDHALSGNYASYRECHIEPDWILLYRIEEDQLVLLATRTGSHADLFKK